MFSSEFLFIFSDMLSIILSLVGLITIIRPMMSVIRPGLSSINPPRTSSTISSRLRDISSLVTEVWSFPNTFLPSLRIISAPIIPVKATNPRVRTNPITLVNSIKTYKSMNGKARNSTSRYLNIAGY